MWKEKADSGKCSKHPQLISEKWNIIAKVPLKADFAMRSWRYSFTSVVLRTLILMGSFSFDGGGSCEPPATPSVTQCIGKTPHLESSFLTFPYKAQVTSALDSHPRRQPQNKKICPISKEAYHTRTTFHYVSNLKFNLMSPNIALDIIFPKLKTH